MDTQPRQGRRQGRRRNEIGARILICLMLAGIVALHMCMIGASTCLMSITVGWITGVDVEDNQYGDFVWEVRDLHAVIVLVAVVLIFWASVLVPFWYITVPLFKLATKHVPPERNRVNEQAPGASSCTTAQEEKSSRSITLPTLFTILGLLMLSNISEIVLGGFIFTIGAGAMCVAFFTVSIGALLTTYVFEIVEMVLFGWAIYQAFAAPVER